MDKINHKTQDGLEHLASFPRLNPNPVIEVDYSGKITFFNPATKKVLENLGKDKTNVALFLPTDLKAILKDREKEGESSLYREIMINDRIFEENIALIPALNVARIYAHDITGRKRMEAELVILNEELEKRVNERTTALKNEIEERKRLEEVLQENALRLQLTLRAANVGLWDWDLQTNKVFYSPEWKSQIGYEDDEISNDFSEWQRRVHPDDLDRSLETVRSFIEKPWLDYRLEFRFHHKDGSYRSILTQASLVFNDQGKPIRMLGSHVDVTDSKKIEEALRKTEMELKEAQRVAQMGSWDWDATTDTNWWSDEYYNVYNFDSKVPPPNYQDHLKVYTDESAERLDVAVKKAMRTGEPYVLDLELADPAGTTRWVSARGEAKRDAGGRIVGLRGTAQNITVQRRVEEALRENEARLKVALTPINMAVFHQDLDLRYTWMYQPQIGYTTEQVIGKTDAELLPPDVARRVTEIKRSVLENVKGARGEVEAVLEDRTIYYDLVVEPLRDMAGQVMGITGASLDITEHKHEREQIRAASIYTRSLIEASIDPLVTIGPDGKITDVNLATEKATGCLRKELIGTDFSDYFTEPEKARAGYKQVFTEGFVRDYPLDIKHREGTISSVLYNASIYKDDAGNAIGVFAAARDITVRKQAEEKVRASLLEKETMLREIHHRVKNNLQVISSLLDLQSSSVQDEKAKVALRESMVRVKTMALIHTQLYQSQDLARVDFGLFIQDLVDGMRQSYGTAVSPVEINVDADEIGLDIGTSIPCGLILNELVANALKHAFPEGSRGRIDICLKREGKNHILKVQDNGIGLPEHTDLANTKTLGLQLVNVLVRQLNGKIDVGGDGGATFVITFPVMKD